jgi:penicillin G amidase
VLSQRVLKFINLSIAVLLILVLIAMWWYMYRPLPKTSGEIRAPIRQPATVVRDALGVPHITAGNLQDALFLEGYVTAQDRMWQMDAIRRLAAGDLAEVVGRAALASDEESRRLRLRRIAEQDYRELSPADRANFDAYARGVNYYLETNRGKWGVEFALIGYDPRPWSVVDSLLAGMQMFRTLTSSWKDEVLKQTMLQGGDREKVDYLFPERTGLELMPGSNAWAIAGSHTASGRPILANDPHLAYAIPSTWYMVALKAPGLDVIGVSLPGLPGVIIGHNDRIAWGVTNLEFDVQDLYHEQFNPRNGQYVYQGHLEQARLEQNLIAVKGQAAVPANVWVTRHGPIFMNVGGQYYSLRWVGADPGGFEFPFLDLDRARNWQEFTKALENFAGPGQNFVYADVDGNIGYQVAGKLPIRRNFDGDVPVDGSSGQFEWDGYIPFDQLPSSFNPPGGLIVTANQNPFPANYPYRVSGSFDSGYRSHQIHDLLSSRNGWRPRDMLAVQKDVYSAFARFLTRQAIAAYDRKKPRDSSVAAAIRLFRGWNGQMDKDDAVPMITDLFYRQLRTAIAERASPKHGVEYTFPMAQAVIEKLLTARPPGWFNDYDSMLLQCLHEAIEDGAQRQGSNVDDWRYGEYHNLTIVQPVDSHLPIIGKYFNIGPVWMSGSPTTVKQTTWTLGPSMRMAVDFSNFDQSLNNITIGESGHFLSSHYKDQWPAYYSGVSFPMQFNHVTAKSTLQVKPEQ